MDLCIHCLLAFFKGRFRAPRELNCVWCYRNRHRRNCAAHLVLPSQVGTASGFRDVFPIAAPSQIGRKKPRLFKCANFVPNEIGTSRHRHPRGERGNNLYGIHRAPPQWVVYAAPRQRGDLWLAGNRRSDTLRSAACRRALRCGLQGIVARIHLGLKTVGRRLSCGLQGIVARIHCQHASGRVASSCGLQGIVARIHSCTVAAGAARGCGLQGIVARIH